MRHEKLSKYPYCYLPMIKINASVINTIATTISAYFAPFAISSISSSVIIASMRDTSRNARRCEGLRAGISGNTPPLDRGSIAGVS